MATRQPHLDRDSLKMSTRGYVVPVLTQETSLSLWCLAYVTAKIIKHCSLLAPTVIYWHSDQPIFPPALCKSLQLEA